MKGKHFLIAIIPVLFGLNSCKTQSVAEASKDSGETITQTTKAADFDSQVTGKYWRLTELYGSKITADPSNTREPHIILKTDGNRLNGHSGCNSFFWRFYLTAR